MYGTCARPLQQGGADFMFCPRAQDTPATPLLPQGPVYLCLQISFTCGPNNRIGLHANGNKVRNMVPSGNACLIDAREMYNPAIRQSIFTNGLRRCCPTFLTPTAA